MKISNAVVPNEEKTFDKLEEAFLEAFISKDLEYYAQQLVYSLSTEKHCQGNLDLYSTEFRLTQAQSGIMANNILVDTLQQGVSNQLATMMTAAEVPQDLKAKGKGWTWEHWLDKAREFYRNIICLRDLRTGGDNIIPCSQGQGCPPPRDPFTIDVDKIQLSPAERAEHL